MPHKTIIIAACFLAPLPVLAQDDQTNAERRGALTAELVTGVEAERSKLNDGQRVEKVTLATGAQVTRGRVSVIAQLPYVRVSAPANVVVSSGPLGLPILVTPTQPAGTTVREGLGDLRLGAAYQLPTRSFAASARGGVKVPTASTSKCLGTGKSDYWAGADVSTNVGRVTPFGGMSYTV